MTDGNHSIRGCRPPSERWGTSLRCWVPFGSRKNALPHRRYSGMRLNSDDTLSLSPSDLSNHLACPHLTTLSVAATRGEIVKPKLESPHRDLIFRKGNEHEAAYLARLEAEGRSVVRIPTYDDEE